LHIPTPGNNGNSGDIDADGNSGMDKPSIGNTNNIGAKRAKFEEGIAKEPIMRVILEVFDGEIVG
jgi:hypothetical protein